MANRRVLFGLGALIAVAAAVLVGMHRGQQTARAQPSTEVSIKDFAFTPPSLTIPPGTTVRWTHNDAAPHTVTSGTPDGAKKGEAFRSSTLMTGGTFTFTFMSEGVFPYFCEIHNRMRGAVEVKAEAALLPPPDLPPAIPPPHVDITAREYSFDAPDTLPAGNVSLTMTNAGAESHHAQIFRVNDGVSLDDLFATFMRSQGAALSMGTLVGGPGTVSPGGTGQEVFNDFTPGQYLLLCFLPSPSDGVAHIAKGMVKPFTVAAADALAPPPVAEADASLFDFGFSLPDIHSGGITLRLNNEGPQSHEMNLLKLAEGKGLDDVFAFFGGAVQGPPPFSAVGGMQALSPGLSGWVRLDLAPGNYVAICNIPDPVSGKSHAALGMVSGFAVP